MRSLDYKKVPEQIACILACIAVFVFTSYLQTSKPRREGIYNAFFFHVCHLHIWDGEQKKKQPHTDLQSTQDMHAKWNVCLTEQRVLFLFPVAEKKE